VNNVLRHIFGLGLKAYATDADPEKLTEAIGGIQSLATEEEAGKKPVPPPEQKLGGLETAKLMAKDDDSPRAGMHRMLDKMLDDRDKKATDKKHADDTDMQELKSLFDEFMDEEATEPSHEEDAVPAALKEHEEEEEEKHEDEPEEADDAAESKPSFIEPVKEGEEEKKPVAASDAISILLREMRPIVAKSKDKRLRSWFNTTAARANDAAKRGARSANGGSYGEFSKAARTEGAQAKDSRREQAGETSDVEAYKKLDEYYKKAARLETPSGRRIQ
jgi:hypothetical protein